MELYYTIFALLWLCLFLEIANSKVKNLVLIAWAIFFTLFGGLRWNTGNDWYQYHNHFLFSNWSNIFNYDRYGNNGESLEPGFVFINVLVKSIFGTFYWYNLLLCAFIQFTYVHVSKYYCKEHPIMMYIFIMLMMGAYFPVRAGFSVAICYWAYQMIRERNLKMYLLIIFIAFNIHRASIVLLPAYWIGRINAKPIFLYAIWGGTLMAGLLFQDVFQTLALLMGGEVGEKAIAYTQTQTANYEDASLSIGAVLLPCFFLFVYLKVRKELTDDRYWINTLINCFVIYKAITFIFYNGMGDLTRLSDYFIFSNAILFMTTIVTLKRFGNIFQMIGVIFFVVYMGFQVTKTCDGYYFEQTNIPYKTIFDYQNTK